MCLCGSFLSALAAPADRGALNAPDDRYKWRPFETADRPPVPEVNAAKWRRNPIDAFIAAEHEARGLKPRPEAKKEVLLRRVYLDLIGLAPTPEEQRAFLADRSLDAYERIVNRLLEDPRHGERWGRHWMDVWRYSDWAGWTDGNQIRDSQRHIWRWRDWIVDSLNTDTGYDRMVLLMLAADELAPMDVDTLPATGFLVRNYKMLSREQWIEDTVKHTAQAFLGITMGCAKCHDHMTERISQLDYYRMRAIFDPHNVRTDKLPGQPDTAKDGLVRAFDTETNLVTYLLIRGDERHPDTNRVVEPGVPVALCGATSLAQTGGKLRTEPVELPLLAAQPDRREFVIRDAIAAAESALATARDSLEKLVISPDTPAEKLVEQALNVAVAQAKHNSLFATVHAEQLEDAGRKDSDDRSSSGLEPQTPNSESLTPSPEPQTPNPASSDWRQAAIEAASAQRQVAFEEARLQLHLTKAAVTKAQRKVADASPNPEAGESTAQPRNETLDKAVKELETAKKKASDAEEALKLAETELQSPPTPAYKARPANRFPSSSTGRRLAFARWVTDPKNPLTARVAMNHTWLRHFGRGIVPTPADFGRNGRPPSHPQLLDWLAAEFMEQGWSLKAMHRLMVTSATYRMASTPDESCARIDPDNVWLWRMPSRRIEAEAVRDNLLYVAGNLDLTLGGPDIDNKLGLVSKRRSLYLRTAAEKDVEFLKIFDGPSVNECYERRPSVIPQQALALANSEFALAQARIVAESLTARAHSDHDFVRRAFPRILARAPTREEIRLCRDFMTANRARQSSAGKRAASASNSITQRARENLVLVLLNHNDFVMVR